MGKDKYVICINREYGSGGRSIGKMLAEELGVHFYDEQILRITAETSAVGEQYFRLADEKAGNNLLYKIFNSLKPSLEEPEVGSKITNPDNLFRFQAKIIRELAARETCIIAGRAADYVLKEAGQEDVVSFFLHCGMQKKIERIMEMESMTAEAAEHKIRTKDKNRSEYYQYYTGQDWYDCTHYDMCINSTNLTFDQAAVIIKNFMRVKGYEL